MRAERQEKGESRLRLVIMATAGIVVGVGTGLAGFWIHAPITGWAAACIVYLAWVWAIIGRLDPSETAAHATREDPSRGTSDGLIVLASIASLFALAFVLGQAHHASGAEKRILAGLAVVSVVLSWFLVHTLYTLRYAREYYSRDARGIDFNQDEPPRYADFAYVSFTLGMTFQVSDTSIRDPALRVLVLRHGLLSYLFGSVILAATVNLIAGLFP